MGLAENTILAGRYEILETIGHGGMATVHRARKVGSRKAVALKALHDHYAGDPEFLARFEREARSAAELNHPNIVRVIEWGEDNGRPFLVMEYESGEDLRTLLQREGPLPPERATEIAMQVCRALAHAHERGIIHRDIKPQNILITGSGQVKVADFGVARAVSASTITQPGTVLGSVPYLSPEQVRGEPAGAASDLYALGIVLYEMVTGRLPFEAETPVATALKHIKEEPVPPRSLNPGTPPRLEGIILRALAKDPAHRFPSAELMRRDLEGKADFWRESVTIPLRAQDHLPAAAAEIVPQRSALRRRMTPPLSALAMLALFGVMLTGWLGGGPYTFSTVVPDLNGMTLDAATSLLARQGLRVDVSGRQFSDDHPYNAVLQQEPLAGARTWRNGIVRLVVSKGPELVVVPDVRRRSLDAAVAALQAARLEAGKVQRVYSSSLRLGTIISQTPAPGIRLAPGSTVTLVVSRGPRPVPTPAPVIIIDPFANPDENRWNRRDSD